MSRVTFPSGEVSIELEGEIHLPYGPGPFPAAVVCHPYPPAGGTMAVPLVRAIAHSLAEVGIVALRFNFRGVGGSGGTFDGGQGEVNDVKGAFAWLNAQPTVDPGRVALVGYSFGATMALAHAIHDDRVRALVLIGLPLTWMASPPVSDRRPCLLVVGERDRFCPLSRLRTFVQESKGDAKIHTIAGADHFLFNHEPEVAGVVTDFLQEAL